MLLKSLELQGFKTFPEKTVLTFNKGITAVVGPNGSGKSNISDAIRWVLGEQSIKSIRCSKMEDVIFNGTAERRAKGFASVTISIINNDRKLLVDNDEVIITRRLYRSGESEYLLNRNEVRLKDINELFMDTGLGKDGYSMISQGKIDDIVSSKSEDRREIFEEAAGISKYRYRKTQAQKRLEQAEENLLRLYDIFKELEERIEPLKVQAQKAKSYLDLANRKKALEIGMWLFTLSKSNDILQDYDNKILSSKNQHDEFEKNLDCFNAKIDEFSKKILSHTTDIDKVRREISECQENSIKKNGQISILKNDISHNEENIQRLSQKILYLEQNFPNMEISINEKIKKLNDLNDIFKEKNLKLKDNEINLKNLSEQINSSINKSEDLSCELSKLNKLNSETQVKTMTIKSNICDLNSRKIELEKSIGLYEKNIDDLNQEILIEESSLNKLKTKLDDSAFKLKNAENNIKNTEKEYENLKKVADKLTLDADTQLRKIRLMEELEQNLDVFSLSVKFLMKEAKNGTLLGVFGPVSKLINVPNKFSVAIETALGASIQNIVVDTEESAKKAIFLLKNSKIGRATFLPVSNLKGFELNDENFKFYAGFVGIASQLCNCDNKFQNILKFLLGKIVVVDSLDNAVLIAKSLKYKFKIVTLDGQVINSGGALTGGSLNKNAGILNRTDKINVLRKEYDKLNFNANNAKVNCSKVQKKLINFKENFEILKSNIEKDRLNFNKVEYEHQQKLLKLNSLKSMSEKFFKEKLEIIKKIETLRLEVSNSEENFNNIMYKIKNVNNLLLNATSNKNEFVEQRENLKTKYHELHLEVFSINKDIETLTSELNFALENKKSSEEQRVKLLSEKKGLNLKNDTIKTQINSIKCEINDLKNLSSKLEQDIYTFNSEKIEFEKNITELRNFERSTLNEKEKLALEIARLEEKKMNVQKEYDMIIAKLWDEYELTRSEAMENFEIIEVKPKNSVELSELRLKIKNLGVVNVASIEEYQQVLERYEFMKSQINDVEKSKKELYRLINDLTSQMKTLFSKKFKQINENFNSVFKELFEGGKAELVLTDLSDVLNSGIDIYVQPPGKIVTHLEALSGGERALIAIALYFAIMKVSPAPFCVLDEIEAALDDVNVDRFAAYLRKMNQNTQFIVISHRRGTMEEADILYGVTMQNEGVSKLLELRSSEIEKNFIS